MGCASSKKNDDKPEVIKDAMFPGGKRSVPKLHLEDNPLLQKRKASKESTLAQNGSNPGSPPDSRNNSKERILLPTRPDCRINSKDAVKPEKMLEFTIDNEDSIGLRLSLVQSPPVVLAVDVGSLAESVGAQVGDYFFAVNGIHVASMSQEYLTETLRDKRPLTVGLVSCGSVRDEGLNGYGPDKDILSGLLSWVVVDGRVDHMLGDSSVDGEQTRLVLRMLADTETTNTWDRPIPDPNASLPRFVHATQDLESKDSLVISITRQDSSHEFDSVTVLPVNPISTLPVDCSSNYLYACGSNHQKAWC